MAKPNISRMNFESLVRLREQVDEELVSRRATLEKQLEALGSSIASGRGSALKGKKVAAKYRGPAGETWAGRGAKPRWLVAATARGTGKKLDDFLIDKSAGKARKKRKSKG